MQFLDRISCYIRSFFNPIETAKPLRTFRHHCNYPDCLNIDADNWESEYQLQTIALLRVSFFKNDPNCVFHYMKITLYAQIVNCMDTIFFYKLKAKVHFNRPKLFRKLSQDELDVIFNLMEEYMFISKLKIEYQRQLLEYIIS